MVIMEDNRTLSITLHQRLSPDLIAGLNLINWNGMEPESTKTRKL